MMDTKAVDIHFGLSFFAYQLFFKWLHILTSDNNLHLILLANTKNETTK